MSSLSRLVNTARAAALAVAERRAHRWPAERIQRIQSKRVRAIVRHAWDSIPFYRAAMEERGLRSGDFRTADNLARLPVLRDTDVWSNPAAFQPSIAPNGDVLRLHTTGSYSKIQKPVPVELSAALRRLVLAERDRRVISALTGRGWGQVQMYLIPDVSNSFRIQEFWDRHTFRRRTLARKVAFPVDGPFEGVVEGMSLLEPDVVFSYGSYADEFFRWLDDRAPSVRLPKVWVYGGDMMSARAVEIAERRFGCPIYSSYQAVESGRIGFQCELRKGFHLNVDYVAVRLIDEAGRDVEPGVEGEIVISNLYNRAMVFLNYRMGDLGVMSGEPCPCGRALPLLARLDGKVMERVLLPDGRRLVAAAVEVEFGKELGAALQIQLTQTGPASMLWRLVPASTADADALRRGVLDKSHKVFGESVDVSVEFPTRIPPMPGGKFRRIYS